MGLFDAIIKKKHKNTTKTITIPETTEPEASASTTRELSPYNHFQAAMNEDDPIRRRKEIEAITNQYWLSRLIKEGKYETDRVQALNQLNDQNILLEIAADGSNLPKIQSLAPDMLDDIPRFRLIEKPYISEADKCRAAAKILDTKLLTEILLRGGFGRTVNLTAARRLELIAPEEAKHYEDIINFLRRKF